MGKGTIIVGLVLLLIVAWIIVRMVQNARRNAPCGGGCGGCPLATKCVKGKEKNLPRLPFTLDQ